MSKNEIPNGGAVPQPEKGRLFAHNRALDETVKFVLPLATAVHDHAERMGVPKSLLPLVMLVGGVDSLRYREVGQNIWNMLSDSSSPDISTIVKMGVLMSPNIIHLASKPRVIREPIKAAASSTVKGAETLIGSRVVKKSLIETASFLFPITACISNKGGIEDREVGEVDKAKKSPIEAFGGAVKTATEFVHPIDRIKPVMPMAAFSDVARYLVAGSLAKEATSTDPTKAAIGLFLAAGAILSPNMVHMASKNRTIREAGKKVGERISKVTKTALRHFPLS